MRLGSPAQNFTVIMRLGLRKTWSNQNNQANVAARVEVPAGWDPDDLKTRSVIQYISQGNTLRGSTPVHGVLSQ